MAQPTFETLLYDVDGGIATITLNRPDRMNAFTPKMALELIAAFDATDADDAVGVVIVTGAASGLGRESALHFAACGATVVAVDINEVGLRSIASTSPSALGTRSPR